MNRRTRLLILAGLLAASTSARAADLEHLTVQLALSPAGSEAALFLAEEKGWYRDAGLDVEILDGRGSAAAIQLVANGQSDVGQGELGPMASAIEKGAKIKAIAGWAQKTDISVFVDKDGPIKTPQDLKGHTVATLATGPWPPVLVPFLAHVGLTKSDITLSYLDGSALFATYSSGRVDALMSIGPYVLPIVNPIRPSRTFDAVDYGIVAPGSGMFVRDTTLASKADSLRRLVRVQIAAWNYVYDGHQDEAVAAILKQRPNAKLNPVVIRGQIDAYQPYFFTPNTKGMPFGWQSPKDWADGIRSMEEAGIIKAGHVPSDYFTNDLIDAKVSPN